MLFDIPKEKLIAIFASLIVIYSAVLIIFSGLNWNELGILDALVYAYPFYIMVLLTSLILAGVVTGKKWAFYLGIIYFCFSAIFFIIAASFLSASFLVAPLVETLISIINIGVLVLIIKKG